MKGWGRGGVRRGEPMLRAARATRRRFSSSAGADCADHPGLTLGVDAATGVARLTLTNARRANPLSLGLMRHATGLLRHSIAPADSGVRVLVLAAEPEAKFFSSGHDLADVFVREGKAGVAARSELELRELFGACSELMLTLRDLPQPTVAVVGGHAGRYTLPGLLLAP